MSLPRTLAALMLAAGLIAACGSDDDNGTADTTAAPTTTAPGPTDQTTATSGTTEPDGTTTDTTADGSTSTSEPVTLEQPAIWPAADVVFVTPEEAAESFVSEVLDVPVNLSEFMQGDARSGEMEVRFEGESGSGPAIVRGLLLLRQLGPDSGWFVLAAVNDNASITSPEAGAEVEAGPITVEGSARGFEGAVTLTAYPAGDAGTQLDQVLTQGGSLADPAPFTETVDLSGAEPGSVVMLLVRGGVGLETDPGEFGAIPVVIAG